MICILRMMGTDNGFRAYLYLGRPGAREKMLAGPDGAWRLEGEDLWNGRAPEGPCHEGRGFQPRLSAGRAARRPGGARLLCAATHVHGLQRPSGAQSIHGHLSPGLKAPACITSPLRGVSHETHRSANGCGDSAPEQPIPDLPRSLRIASQRFKSAVDYGGSI